MSLRAIQANTSTGTPHAYPYSQIFVYLAHLVHQAERPPLKLTLSTQVLGHPFDKIYSFHTLLEWLLLSDADKQSKCHFLCRSPLS